MNMLYLTADQTSGWSGGQQVTRNESAALKELGPCEVWDRNALKIGTENADKLSDPWDWDAAALEKVCRWYRDGKRFDLCHIYAGCFTETVGKLREYGCRISFTVAAHCVERSRKAHEDLGLPFPYEHLNDPVLFKEYIGGYLNADVVVCPSTVSAETVRRQGRTGRIEIVPHGIDLPKCKGCGGKGYIVFALDDGSDGYQDTEHDQCDDCNGTGLLPLKPLPKTFTVGYLGAFGADKGVRTLLEAWKRLNYADSFLVLGGRDSTSDWTQHLCQKYGGGNIFLAGWQDNPWDFMDQLSCYVQPSATEGFGIEIIEGMARGRVVISSDQNAGPDLLDKGLIFPAGDVALLARKIDAARKSLDWNLVGGVNAEHVKSYTWNVVRQYYQTLWRELLA